MQYQTSQYKYLLLLNIPLPIYISGGDIINIKTPSLEKYYQDADLRKLEALFLTDINEIAPEITGFITESYLELLISLKSSELNQEILAAFEDISGTQVEKNGIFYNGVELSEEDVLEIRAVLLTSTGKMNIDGKLEGEEEEETEMERKMREAEEKIKQIKSSDLDEDKPKKVSFDQMIFLLIYEMGLSIEELRQLNYFGIVNFFAFTENIPWDKIKKISAGNGLLDKKNAYESILSIQ